jgi:hypothetical protein
MTTPFVAVHESGIGTFKTCRRQPGMSAYWGRPEIAGRWPKRHDRPDSDIGPGGAMRHQGKSIDGSRETFGSRSWATAIGRGTRSAQKKPG